MSRTLNYTVQRVCEKLDLDAVDSINDSQDAILIAREAEDTFFDLVSRNEWPERHDLLEIESMSDTNLPTGLRLPPNVLNISSLRYDITNPFVELPEEIKNLEQLSPEDFLDLMYSRNSDDASVYSAMYKDIPLYLINDQAPTYYTTFDNKIIVLDSWVSTVETTVQGFKTIARGASVPTWLHEDSFVIPIDAVTYPLYLSELTAACSVYLNGAQSLEDERRRRSGMSRMRRKAFRTDNSIQKNEFGRKGNGVS